MLKFTHFVFILIVLGGLTALSGCGNDDGPTMEKGVDLTGIPYNPQPYDLVLPETYKNLTFVIPEDNPLTQDGVQLGRHLFHDPIMSLDSTVNCSGCHNLKLGFSDPSQFSIGIEGRTTPRHSMSLLNVGYVSSSLFWDGRASSLEEQAAEPIVTFEEFDHTIAGAENRIRNTERYHAMFRKAFGIENTQEITIELITKAIAQFERIIISGGEAKFDRYLRNEYRFTDEELNGFEMFFDINPDLKDAECAHCHAAPLMTTDDFVNNGLQCPEEDLIFPDNGRGLVTGNRVDNGKMRIPHLRNIGLTAPYMHDGRFNTLEEVIDHYSSGGCLADNIDGNMRALNFTPDEKEELIAFLHTLTDTSYFSNPDLSSPF